MKTSYLTGLAALAGSALAQNTTSSNTTSTSSSPLTLYTLQAENITAIVLPYGGRLVSCQVPDRNGDLQDVVVGHNNGSEYVTDSATNHTYFGKAVSFLLRSKF